MRQPLTVNHLLRRVNQRGREGERRLLRVFTKSELRP